MGRCYPYAILKGEMRSMDTYPPTGKVLRSVLTERTIRGIVMRVPIQ